MGDNYLISRNYGPFLNDILESGPSLTPLLTDVLLRFCSFNYVFVAYIEKSFHQINLNLDHRNLVRFLWFKDIEKLDFECFEKNLLIDFVEFYLALHPHLFYWQPI